MFAQVACLACGKPFQVDRQKLGRPVPCPWCGKDTEAVPVAVDVQPLPPAEPAPPEPAPPKPAWNERAALPLAVRPAKAVAKTRTPLVWVAYAALLLFVAGAVFVGVRLLTVGTALNEFTTPDGSCKVLLPGRPREMPTDPTDEFFPSGKRFVSAPGPFNKLGGEVGWFDLPVEDAKLIRPEDLFRTVRERRAGELGATAEGEAVLRVDSFQGVEVRFSKDNVRHLERYLFDPKAAPPRVYWVSVGGPDFDPDSAVARKAVGSLRVTK